MSYFNGVVGRLVPLITTEVPMAELRFGDFDGDGRTDIFFTDEGRWRIWSPVKGWRDGRSSKKPVKQLRFGEFDGVTGTDVVGINSDGWAYSSRCHRAVDAVERATHEDLRQRRRRRRRR